MRMNSIKVCVDPKTGNLSSFRITNAKQYGTGVLKVGTLPVLQDMTTIGASSTS